MSKSQPTVSFYLSQVLDNIGDAVIVTNLKYQIIKFNKAAEKIYGWQAEEIMGRRLSDCVPTEYIGNSAQAIETLFKKDGAWKGEVIQKTKTGQSIIVASHVVCFTNSEGKEIGIVAINRDITEQKQHQIALERSETIWRTFANTLPDISFIFDKEGRYVEILNSRDELLYYPKDKLLNNYVDSILPDEVARKFLETIQKTLETGEAQIVEYVLPLARGNTWFEAHTSCFQVASEAEPMVIWLARNITERRMAEQQRLELEGLETKFEAEQAVSHFRNQLLTTISHEFRTPLSIIETSSYILQRYGHKLTLDKQEQRLNTIHEQVRHIKEMLDNISQTIEIMNQEFEVTSSIIEVDFLFIELRNALAGSNNPNRIEFTSTVEKIYADRWILEMILLNCLNNALRYSSPDSTIHCIINSDTNYLQIEIIDSGIGIPEQEIDKIFEPHFRCSNTREVRGIGLGLSLVKNFVSRLDGKIYVESRVDEGSKFTILLPLLAFEDD